MHYWDGEAKEGWADGLVALAKDANLQKNIEDMSKQGLNPNLWWNRDNPDLAQPIPPPSVEATPAPVPRPGATRRKSRKEPPMKRRKSRIQTPPRTSPSQSTTHEEPPLEAEVRQAPPYRPAPAPAPAPSDMISDDTVPFLPRRKSAAAVKLAVAAPAPVRLQQPVYRDPTPPPPPPRIASAHPRPLQARGTTYRHEEAGHKPVRASFTIHLKPYTLPPLPYGKTTKCEPSENIPGFQLQYLYPLNKYYVPSMEPLAYRYVKEDPYGVLQPESDWQQYRRPRNPGR